MARATRVQGKERSAWGWEAAKASLKGAGSDVLCRGQDAQKRRGGRGQAWWGESEG